MAIGGRRVKADATTDGTQRLSDTHHERLPDRLLRDGPRSLSDAELVAVLLHSSCRRGSASEIAHDLLRDLGGLAGLSEVDGHLIDRPGVSKVRAAILMAVRELAARLGRTQLLERQVLDHPAVVANYLTLRYARADQEVLGVLFLDTHHRLIADRELFRGTLTRIQVEPRQIFREALRYRASSIALFHTHPTGDPTPSEDDRAFTRRIDQAGRLVGIRLVDHLILGGLGRWTSMTRQGLI